MNCPNCNYEMSPTETFCTNCGERVGGPVIKENVVYHRTTIQPAMVSPEVSHAKTFNLFDGGKINFIGIIASVVVMFFGILTTCGAFNSKVRSTGSVSGGTTVSTDSITYGGDAYTGMQNASADASNNAAVAAKNVEKTNELLKDAIDGYNSIQSGISSAVGMLIICLGLLGGAHYTTKFLKEKKECE